MEQAAQALEEGKQELEGQKAAAQAEFESAEQRLNAARRQLQSARAELEAVYKRQGDVSVLQKRGKVCKIEFKMYEGERQCIPTTPGAFVRLRWR